MSDKLLEKAARNRKLMPSEAGADCPECKQPKGKKCRWTQGKKGGWMLSAHLGRRHLFSQLEAARKVREVLESNGLGDAVSRHKIAAEIVVALLIGQPKPPSPDRAD